MNGATLVYLAKWNALPSRYTTTPKRGQNSTKKRKSVSA